MPELFNPLLVPGSEPPDDNGIVKAARLIAGGEPPDWLLAAPVLHSRIVGGDRVTGEDEKKIDETLWQARRNIDQLVGFSRSSCPT